MSKKYKIDDIDLKIIEILAKDGRISNIELSKLVGVSPSPCLRRVNILQAQGIIKGYGAEVNFPALDYNLIVFASISVDIDAQQDNQEPQENSEAASTKSQVSEAHKEGDAGSDVKEGEADKRSEFEQALNAISEVLEVYVLSSEKDYLAKIIVKDYADYKVVVNSKLAKLPFIKNIRTTRINRVIKSSNFITGDDTTK